MGRDQQDSVTVNILGNGKIVKEVVLNKENNWTATVDVKQTDENENPITYSVEEVTVPGYTTEIERICLYNPELVGTQKLGTKSENIGTFNSQTTVDECRYYQDEEYTITNTMINPTTPTITKDVEGKDHLDVDFEKSFNYNIKATVPEVLVGYETLTIKDTLNERLAIEDVKVLVGGSASDLTASVNGQEVTLTHDRAQLENIKGKEITVQVTAHIKGDTPIENTENVATIQLNNEEENASNVVTVKPKQPSTTEENGSDNGDNNSGNDRDDQTPDDPWEEPTTDEGEGVAEEPEAPKENAEEPETTDETSVETEQPKSKILQLSWESNKVLYAIGAGFIVLSAMFIIFRRKQGKTE